MKPDLRQRRVVEVLARVAWQHTLKHCIYSCPDTQPYEYVRGATALILKHGGDGRRVPLEVTSVVKLGAGDTQPPKGLEEHLRKRLLAYCAALEGNHRILNPRSAHRFYFLGDESWPEWLQSLTTPEHCSETEWTAVLSVCTEPERFFEWPQTSALLWPACRRQANRPYKYPRELVVRLGELGLKPDVRLGNGPAITAFLAAGGRRPIWGNEGWPIHHIYDGTGAVPGGPQITPHAVHDGQHFTHSAGLVAAHPVAHHLARQSKLLQWLLRREALLRFGFDPGEAFAAP